MNSIEFKAWRSDLGLTRSLAAKMLGIAEKDVDYYEQQLPPWDSSLPHIPGVVEVSCHALTLQRGVWQALRLLEPIQEPIDVQSHPDATQRAQRCAQTLNNLLFDVNVLVSLVSRLSPEEEEGFAPRHPGAARSH